MNNYLQKRAVTLANALLPIFLFFFCPMACYADTQTANTASANQAVNETAGQTTTLDPTGAADQAAAASTETASADPAPVKDPYEKFNRGMFSFNDKLDTYLLKPIATFYNTIMPRPLNEGIHNFFLNIGNLPTIANDILQFNFYQMANDLWRLGVNTTVGVGGLFDIADRMGLKPYVNDFGLTLATWGYDNSNYLVLPFFGPNTIRDAIGIPVDYYAFSIYPHIKPYRTRYAIYGLGVIDRRAQLLQFQSVLEEASLDKYVFVRNAYMQRRAYQIDQNQHLSFADRGWEPYRPAAAVSDTTIVDTADTSTETTTDATSANNQVATKTTEK